jgi:hypothetical protein
MGLVGRRKDVRNIRLAVCALVVLVVAGCGPGPRSDHDQVAPVTVSTTSTTEVPAVSAAANQAKSAAEAERLLGLVTLPPGAAALTSTPLPSLAAPPVSPGSSTSLIDRSAMWTVPMSLSATLQWFASHHPGGLSQSGAGSLSTHGVTTVSGYGYSAPSSAAWAEALVEIAVAPLGPSSSELRADGMTVWIDPVPLRDSQPGPRMSVDVASGCPASDRAIVGVTNPGAPLNDSLLPPGEPTAGLVCVYDGANGDAFALKQQTALDATSAPAFAARFRQIPLGHADDGVSYCPMDDGSATVIALRYPDRRNVDLWMRTTGCTSISNGFIAASTLGVG